MCYYNGQKVTRSEFIRLKNLEKVISKYSFLNRDLNIGFEYGKSVVLKRRDTEEDFDIVEMEWGFLPGYIRNREQAAKFRTGYKKENGQWQEPILTLNAMSEEMLLPKKMYREAALSRRCLILSSDSETGEYIETLSLVTTAANKLMQQVHNSKKRMPTILTEDLAWEWLFGNLDDQRITEIARFQFPAEQMEACTLAKDFRTALEPAAPFLYEDLPALELV